MAQRSVSQKRTTRAGGRVPLARISPHQEACFELEDNSVVQRSAIGFFRAHLSRDFSSTAARLAEQFEIQNQRLFTLMNVRLDHLYNGTDVILRFQSGNEVGAVPLFSPTSAVPDYGLIVKPRFAWSGIGEMLAQMGWRIAPTPLKLPLLRRSERRVPLWILSLMILAKLTALLDSMTRRFETVKEIRNAPRGLVHWAGYVNQVSKGQFTQIPCTYPDLRDDRLLKGAIRHCLERHLKSLQPQREYGAFVHNLIELYEQTLRRVWDVPSYEPSPRMVSSWLQRPLRTQHFAEGIQAIEWTVEERGLAGLSDLEGIPWIMPMERFYEAWVETVFCAVARQTGGQLKVARKRETTQPLNWDPPYAGSQKSLMPDLLLEWDSTTLIVDAKYKRHWDELQHRSWFQNIEEIREQHRHDLLQVLAYSSLARTEHVIACLAYPCSPESWAYLQDRDRLIYKAEIASGYRSLRLWLTAIPMATSVQKIVPPMTQAIKALLRES